MGEPPEQPPAAMLASHPGFWGEAGGPQRGGAMAELTGGCRAAGLGCLIRAEPFTQRQGANYYFFLGIRGSSLEGAGKKTGLPWRLPGWGGGWKLSRVAVGFLGLETCF